VRVRSSVIFVLGLLAQASAFGTGPIPHAAVFAAPHQVTSPAQAAGSVDIDGRVHPELIPPEIAWEHFFYEMVSVGFDDAQAAQPSPKMVTALSRYNLFIPPEQVTTVLLVAKATVTKVNALRQSAEPGVGTSVHPTTPQTNASQIAAAILSGRNTLIQQLSRDDMAAVDHYVMTTVVHSIKIHKGHL
jgi:hypothetical protein